MDLQTNAKIVALIMQYLDPSKPIDKAIQTEDIKPSFKEGKIKQAFERATPEEVGISSDLINTFITQAKNDKTLNMHGISIIKNEKMIAEVEFGSYKKNIWHITNSECKSIISLAIGILVDEGRLAVDDRLIDILAEESTTLSKITHRGITIRHLLTMTTGVNFNEAGALVEEEWTKKYFEASLAYESGKKFTYNSLNTYMLAVIITKITGKSVTEFLNEKLFKVMGIENYYWEKSPEGIEKGGWGLYIIAEDIGKIGQLVLNKGLWNGVQLISEKWINEATKTQVITPESHGKYDYGYQIWTRRDKNIFLFNGMFGQNVLGNFDNDSLIITNGGNSELFQQSNFFKYYEKAFVQGEIWHIAREKDKKAYKRLKETIKGVKEVSAKIKKTRAEVKKQEALFEEINNIEWIPEINKAGMLSIFPFTAQIEQNNYTKGMSSFQFIKKNGVKTLIVKETDEKYEIPLELGKTRYTRIVFHKEEQIVAVSSRVKCNEDDAMVLLIRLSFLEIANERLLKVVFDDENNITVKFLERPGKEYIKQGVGELKNVIRLNTILNVIGSPRSEEYINYKIDSIFEPIVKAQKKSLLHNS